MPRLSKKIKEEMQPFTNHTTGKQTEGVAARLLTNSSTNPHGIKVMLADEQVGRVQEIL